MGKNKKKNKKKFILTVIKQPICSGDSLCIMEVQQFKGYSEAFTAMYRRAEELYGDKIYIVDNPNNVDIVLENKNNSWIGRIDLDDTFGCMAVYTHKGPYVISFHEVGFRSEAEYGIAVLY